MSLQEQVSESTTQTVLDKLLPDTRYRVTVVPVYAEGDGLSLTDTGKTSKAAWRGLLIRQTHDIYMSSSSEYKQKQKI